MGICMKRFVEGVDRGQGTFSPERLEDWIGDDNLVGVIDVFVDALDLLGCARRGSILVEHALKFPPVLRLRQRQHQQNPCLLRRKVIGQYRPRRSLGGDVPDPAAAGPRALDDDDAVRVGLAEGFEFRWRVVAGRHRADDDALGAGFEAALDTQLQRLFPGRTC